MEMNLYQFVSLGINADGTATCIVDLDGVPVVDDRQRRDRIRKPDFRKSGGAHTSYIDRRLSFSASASFEFRAQICPMLRSSFAGIGPAMGFVCMTLLRHAQRRMECGSQHQQ